MAGGLCGVPGTKGFWEGPEGGKGVSVPSVPQQTPAISDTAVSGQVVEFPEYSPLTQWPGNMSLLPPPLFLLGWCHT